MNFDRLDAHLKAFYEIHPNLPGCDILVQQNHRTLYRQQYGYADLQNKIPLRGEEIYCMYSCSKPITVAGVMRLMQDGLLDLDAPVSRYLPCFADAYLLENTQKRNVSKSITIRHLLTMTAGFTYDLNTEPIKALFKQNDHRIPTTEFAKALLASPLAFEPGTRYNYSLCHDLLGAVIEAVSGVSFGEYLHRNIFEPLGMTRTGFFSTLPADTQPIPMYIWKASEQNAVPFIDYFDCGLNRHYQSGGAGILSTVEDYGKFAATMAHGGQSVDGYELLKAETLEMMRQEQLSAIVSEGTFVCAAGPGYGYGLGVRTLINRNGGQRSPIGEFGWDGAAGAYVLMDTDNDLSIFYATHLRNWHGGFGSIHAPIRDLVYECLGL